MSGAKPQPGDVGLASSGAALPDPAAPRPGAESAAPETRLPGDGISTSPRPVPPLDLPAGGLSNLAGAGPVPAIDGYEILGLLGEGGMGVVYKARHLTLQRLVALKTIRSGAYAGSEELLRFRIEAEAVARLQHPNIVQIFDVGQCAGLCYLTLELVDGGSLAGRIAGRPQRARDAATLVELLARAVHAAHLRGILHRDLKPGNVLLTADGVPKISDFGLAKRLDQEDVTESHSFLGTVGYMAPEQAWGSSQSRDIGPAADVYGLGVILYEMLTGRVPFRGQTPRDTLEQVWTQEPTPPGRLERSVPRDLETICLKCLEKVPHRRYGSAGELADDLHRFLADEPIHARPVSRFECTAKWARRRPALAVLVGVVMVSLAALGGGGAYYQKQLYDALQAAKANLTQARVNLHQAQDAVDQLLTQVSLERLAPLPQSEQLRRELLEVALRFCDNLRREHPDDPMVANQAARAQRQVADIYQLLGRRDEAAQAYRQAIAEFAALAKEHPDDAPHADGLAGAYNNLALSLEHAGRLAEAEEAFRQAVALWQQVAEGHPDDHEFRRELALGQSNLAVLLNRLGRVAEAERAQRYALAIRRELTQAQPNNAEYQRDLATSRNNLGTTLLTTGKPVEAEETFRLAVAAFEKLPPPDASQPTSRQALASSLNNLAAVLVADGHPEEAEQLYRRARQVFAALAVDFPAAESYQEGWAQTESNLGLALVEGQSHPEARQVLGESLARYEALLAKTPASPAYRQGVATVLQRLALADEAQGDQQAAENALARALKLGEALANEFPENPEFASQLGIALQSTADLLIARGKSSQAQRYLREAVRYQETAHKANGQNLAYRLELKKHYETLAGVLIELGEAAEAAQIAERLPELFPETSEAYTSAAGLLARCIPLSVGVKGDQPSPQSGKPLKDYCGDRAVELLRAALAKGEMADRLKDDPTLATLRDRADFQGLVRGRQKEGAEQK